jgi:transcriptional regulator with XRE-family HTH domain
MGSDARRIARADRRTTLDLIEIGSTCREARVGSGTSQQRASEAVGMSRSQLARLETGVNADASLRQLQRLAAANGLRLVVRAYPDHDPVRDVAHARLLERFRLRLHPSLRWRTEVPLHGSTGLRAWDGLVERPPRRTAVEAETRIRDSQALERRLALKLRDDQTIESLILLVAETAGNRAALAVAREHLRGAFPLDTREILGALGAGRLPDAGGIVVL